MSIFNTPPSTTDPLKLLQSFQEKRDASKGGVNGIMSDSNSNTDVDDFVASTYDALNNRRMLAMEEVAEERNAVLASYTAPAEASTISDNLEMASYTPEVDKDSEITKLIESLITESYGEENDSVTDSTNAPGTNTIVNDGNSAGKVVEPEVDGLMSRPYNAKRMIEINNPVGGTTNTTDADRIKDINDPVGGSFAIISKGSAKPIFVDKTLPITKGYKTLAGSEGTDIHLDGRNYLTLPYGVVPDKGSIKKADGTSIDPQGNHGLTATDLAGIDYSSATKLGISRKDYDSDEAFGKAVFGEFTIRAEKKFGAGFTDATDGAKQAVYDLAWNYPKAAGWNDTKLMVTEASKPLEDQSTANLIQFTQNFMMTDNGVATYPRGLLKRRAVAYNLVAKPGEEASDIFTTAVINSKGVRTGTKYEIRTASNTVLTTYTKPDKDEVLGSLPLG